MAGLNFLIRPTNGTYFEQNLPYHEPLVTSDQILLFQELFAVVALYEKIKQVPQDLWHILRSHLVFRFVIFKSLHGFSVSSLLLSLAVLQKFFSKFKKCITCLLNIFLQQAEQSILAYIKNLYIFAKFGWLPFVIFISSLENLQQRLILKRMLTQLNSEFFYFNFEFSYLHIRSKNEVTFLIVKAPNQVLSSVTGLG